MSHEIYLNAKQTLIREAREAKRTSDDKPYIRQVINDQADQMRRQIDFYAMQDKFSEAAAAMYKNWIDNLACRLHPKSK
jgi:hypothetical protein